MTDAVSEANAWRHDRPELTDTLRLLLLLSRVKLYQQQRERVLALCERIDDWDDFARKAAEHFIAPLCLFHLGRIENDRILSEARAALSKQVKPMVMQTLRLAAMQRRFIENQVRPFGADFAVIKGRALAARYYPETSMRYARDLDVLVPVDWIPELVVSAQEEGYRVYPERRLLSIDEAHVLSRQSPVVTLIGKDHIAIEVHAQLDKAGFLLDHRAMLDRVESIKIDGVETGVLPTTDHFVYICLHHTKHFWSRLNWLTDLDAMIQAPDFYEGAVMALARVRGLEKTISACIELHQACAAEDPWAEAAQMPEALDLLRACLVILDQGASKEFKMRPDRLSVDFNFEWQIPPGFRRRQRWRANLEACRPSVADFHAMPLPRAWQWVYYITRPVRLLFRRKAGTPEIK